MKITAGNARHQDNVWQAVWYSTSACEKLLAPKLLEYVRKSSVCNCAACNCNTDFYSGVHCRCTAASPEPWMCCFNAQGCANVSPQHRQSGMIAALLAMAMNASDNGALQDATVSEARFTCCIVSVIISAIVLLQP